MTTPTTPSPSPAPPPREMTRSELDRTGLLHAEPGVHISRLAIFVPADALGELRPITVRSGAVIAAGAVIHGGAVLAEQTHVEEHAVVGKPELGYAVGRIYPGAGASTVIGAGAVLRSGAIVYAAVRLGVNVVVGHHTLLRTAVEVGTDTQLGHFLSIERQVRIGRDVRCSPGSHITSSTVLADQVFLGAGVRTINDRTLIWRDPYRKPELIPPRFETGAKIGTGCIVLGGITVGGHALVGAGSLITRDIPAGALAFGQPARVRGQAP
ncbi:MAG: hypothetical protein ACRDSP_13250 [Pseudonocardiaceae bacterium]